jgi:hypothetical protein
LTDEEFIGIQGFLMIYLNMFYTSCKTYIPEGKGKNRRQKRVTGNRSQKETFEYARELRDARDNGEIDSAFFEWYLDQAGWVEWELDEPLVFDTDDYLDKFEGPDRSDYEIHYYSEAKANVSTDSHAGNPADILRAAGISTTAVSPVEFAGPHPLSFTLNLLKTNDPLPMSLAIVKSLIILGKADVRFVQTEEPNKLYCTFRDFYSIVDSSTLDIVKEARLFDKTDPRKKGKGLSYDHLKVFNNWTKTQKKVYDRKMPEFKQDEQSPKFSFDDKFASTFVKESGVKQDNIETEKTSSEPVKKKQNRRKKTTKKNEITDNSKPDTRSNMKIFSGVSTQKVKVDYQKEAIMGSLNIPVTQDVCDVLLITTVKPSSFPEAVKKHECCASLVKFDSGIHIVVPKHYLSHHKDSTLYFNSRTSIVTVVIPQTKWLCLDDPDADVVFSRCDELTRLAKAYPLASNVFFKASDKGQVSMVRPESSTGHLFRSVSGVMKGYNSGNAWSYRCNSTLGTCGSAVVNGENHCVGIHIGTSGNFNMFQALFSEMGSVLKPWDFQ